MSTQTSVSYPQQGNPPSTPDLTENYWVRTRPETVLEIFDRLKGGTH